MSLLRDEGTGEPTEPICTCLSRDRGESKEKAPFRTRSPDGSRRMLQCHGQVRPYDGLFEEEEPSSREGSGGDYLKERDATTTAVDFGRGVGRPRGGLRRRSREEPKGRERFRRRVPSPLCGVMNQRPVAPLLHRDDQIAPPNDGREGGRTIRRLRLPSSSSSMGPLAPSFSGGTNADVLVGLGREALARDRNVPPGCILENTSHKRRLGEEGAIHTKI